MNDIVAIRILKRAASNILLVALLLCCLTGCHSQKKAVEGATGYQSTSSFEWERLSMPVKIRLEGSQNLSISGTATFIGDESVYFSLRMLGMEVAAMELTRDSIALADKFHKYYLKASWKDVSKELNLQLSDVECLLLGRVPSRSLAKGGRGYTVDMAEKDGMIERIVILVDGKEPFTVDYGKGETTPYGMIAESLKAQTELKGKDMRLTVEWSPGKAKWNSDVAARSLTIGRGYKEIELENIKQIFSTVVN